MKVLHTVGALARVQQGARYTYVAGGRVYDSERWALTPDLLRLGGRPENSVARAPLVSTGKGSFELQGCLAEAWLVKEAAAILLASWIPDGRSH